MTAVMMLFCIICGGNMQPVFAEVIDKTVYIAVQPSTGTPGSRVPVTIDFRTDYFITMMSVIVHYDSHLKLVPVDPAVPDEPKSEVDLRSSVHEKPHTSGYHIVPKPEDSAFVISSTSFFRQGHYTVWFDLPVDAAVGTEYPVTLSVNVLYGKYLTEKLTASLTDGAVTVIDHPAETTTTAPVEAAFDITEKHLDLTDTADSTLWTSQQYGTDKYHQIAYTASANLDYIEWQTDNHRIYLNSNGQISGFNFAVFQVIFRTSQMQNL